MNVDVLSPQGSATGSVELPAGLFDVQVNVPLIHQVVVGQLAAARQGTADTKTRGEVRGGGRKPYKQKGTGRARQGSTRAPQFTGGGVVHGPTPRDYSQRTPKKMKVAALRGALSDRARNGRVHVLSAVVDGVEPSTKSAAAVVRLVSQRPNVLVVLERDDIVGWKSVRNVAGVHLLVVDQLNAYDVLCSDDVIFTEGALKTLIATRPAGRALEPAADEEVVGKVARVVKDAAATAIAEVSEVGEELAEKVAEAGEQVADKVEKVKAEVVEKTEDVIAKVAEAKTEVTEKVEDVVAKVAEAKTGVTEKASEVGTAVVKKVSPAKAAPAEKPSSVAAADAVQSPDVVAEGAESAASDEEVDQ